MVAQNLRLPPDQVQFSLCKTIKNVPDDCNCAWRLTLGAESTAASAAALAH
jgi:hypothetical protein